MVGYVAWGIYFIGFALCWRRNVWAIAQSMNFRDDRVPRGEDLIFGLFVGTIITLGWPIILAGRSVHAIYKVRGQSVALAFAPRREREQIELKLREKEVRRIEYEQTMREIEIRRLERETGIGQ